MWGAGPVQGRAIWGSARPSPVPRRRTKEIGHAHFQNGVVVMSKPVSSIVNGNRIGKLWAESDV